MVVVPWFRGVLKVAAVTLVALPPLREAMLREVALPAGVLPESVGLGQLSESTV
jgi:hypothetical protein